MLNATELGKSQRVFQCIMEHISDDINLRTLCFLSLQVYTSIRAVVDCYSLIKWQVWYSGWVYSFLIQTVNSNSKIVRHIDLRWVTPGMSSMLNNLSVLGQMVSFYGFFVTSSVAVPARNSSSGDKKEHCGWWEYLIYPGGIEEKNKNFYASTYRWNLGQCTWLIFKDTLCSCLWRRLVKSLLW